MRPMSHPSLNCRIPKASNAICLWASRTGGRIANTARSTSHSTSIQLMLRRFPSLIALPRDSHKDNAGRVDSPGVVVIVDRFACLSLRTYHTVRPQRQRLFCFSCLGGGEGRDCGCLCSEGGGEGRCWCH